MPTYKMPQSVREWLFNPAVATAVHLLLGKDPDKVAVDMDWDELPAYYKSYLAAHQTKAEYALMSFEIRELVWDKAIKATDFESKFDQNTREHHVFIDEYSARLDELWDQTSVMEISYSRPERKDELNHFGIYCCSDSNSIKLLFSTVDAKTTRNLPVMSPWETDLGQENWRYSEGFKINNRTGEVELAPMIDAAKAVLNAVLKLQS